MRVHCPRCGTDWQQVSNRTGHCSACHRTFSSEETFDAHQMIRDGHGVCLDPATLVNKRGEARFRVKPDRYGAQVWRPAKEFRGAGETFRRAKEGAPLAESAPNGAPGYPSDPPDGSGPQTGAGEDAA